MHHASPHLPYGPPASARAAGSASGGEPAAAILRPGRDDRSPGRQLASRRFSPPRAKPASASVRAAALKRSAELRSAVWSRWAAGRCCARKTARLAEAAGRCSACPPHSRPSLQRLEGGDGERPLLEGEAQTQLAELLEQRAAHYASFPLQLDTRSIAQSRRLPGRRRCCLGMFRVAGMGAGYDVRAPRRSGADWGWRCASASCNGPLALVSDENVAALYAEPALESLREAGYTVQPAGDPRRGAAQDPGDCQPVVGGLSCRRAWSAAAR